MPAWTFPHCPTAPDWNLDWDGVLEAYPWLHKLGGCPQNPVYHAEGDVLTHTRMVTQALVAHPVWRALEPEARSILFAAALLHDVGKPEKTVIEDDGRITSRGHAGAGARIAQRVLWLEAHENSYGHVPFHARQAVVSLVRFHGLPLFFLERDDPRRAVIEASFRVRLDWVSLLAEADVRGRICPDAAELLGRVELFRSFCAEHACLDTPYPFASDHSRFLYCRTPGRDPTYHAFDDTRLTVVLLCGVPGAGKDTFNRNHLPDWPSVHLDAIRRELGVSWTDNQGHVFQLARERARGFLRAQTSFVWNATNITRSVRDPLINLFADYGARVRIVYIEPRLETILHQNQNRDAVVKESVIRDMISRLEVPDLTEAHQIEYVIR